MTIFLDTNVFIDMVTLRDRIEDNRNAARLLALATQEEFDFFVSPVTVSNSFYVTRKDSGALARIKSRLGAIGVLPMEQKDVHYALTASSLPDKEDAMQMSCAQRAGCDIILTRDSRHFSESPVPVMSPSEFLSRLEY